MNIIITSSAVLGSLGFIFGIGLTYISYKFAVQIDRRIEELLLILPNVNCGSCGFTGCNAYAEKLAHGETSAPNLCVPGGETAAKQIAKVMGIEEVGCLAKRSAVVICGGGEKEAIKQFNYDGVATCLGAGLIAGGNKACKFGCLGFGDCTRVCPFNAIHIGSNGLPIINENCTGCGKCVTECPKKVITLVNNDRFVNILCHSNDKGIVVRKNCQKGCIACFRCIKACPKQAIEIENNLAFINYQKCDNCGVCINVCPTNTIIKRKIFVCNIN